LIVHRVGFGLDFRLEFALIAALLAAFKSGLTPGFEDHDRDGIREIQAPVARPHRQADTALAFKVP
jgi:hypothetical protein